MRATAAGCAALMTMSKTAAGVATIEGERKVMEIDIDDVPWKDDLVSHPPVIQNGELIVPTRPGWGADINEEAVKAHPPKNPHP